MINQSSHLRSKSAAILAAVCCLLVGTAQAFPVLNLTPGMPDIQSSFIDVTYAGTNSAGILTASGFANVLTPPGSPQGNIVGGTFDLTANISFNSLTASGTFNIGGQLLSLGFNSGLLLTGTLSSLGAGPGDPLEFIFNVTGGDAAGLIGSTAGVILSQSGYTGSFDSNFASAPFNALANTFAVNPVPEPVTVALLALGLAGIGYQRHKQDKAT